MNTLEWLNNFIAEFEGPTCPYDCCDIHPDTLRTALEVAVMEARKGAAGALHWLNTPGSLEQLRYVQPSA